MTSQKRTVTVLRVSSGIAAAGASGLPQAAQNRAASGFSTLQRGKPPWPECTAGSGKLLAMATRRARVLAYVTREREGRIELLVFDQQDDPGAGTQVPAGRLDPGEALEDGLRRELHEESGLDRVRIVRELPVLGEWVERSEYDDHAFEVCVDGAELPDTWEHVVHGDGDDAGLVFLYRWEPVEAGPRVLERPRLDLDAAHVKALAVALAAGTFAFSGLTVGSPRVAGCPVFPTDNPWNQRVDRLPVAKNSSAVIDSIGADTGLHPDFGSGLWEAHRSASRSDRVTRAAASPG